MHDEQPVEKTTDDIADDIVEEIVEPIKISARGILIGSGPRFARDAF